MRKRGDPLADLGLKPKLDYDLPTLLHWLSQQRLTYIRPIFDRTQDARLPGVGAPNERVALAQSTDRLACYQHTQQELKDLKERHKDTKLGINRDQLWEAVLHTERSVRTLKWDRLPANAMAFYRPFHFPPFDQWGIYLLIDPLLSYQAADESKRSAQAVFARSVNAPNSV